MKKSLSDKKKNNIISIKLLLSYLGIILAPAVAIIIIYITMQESLLDIQKEKFQSLAKEAVLTFDNEMDQVVNIGRYISTDTNLKEYLDSENDFISSEDYFKAYKLALSYPDYVLLNRFVKGICILPQESDYIIQIPRVIPNTLRGISTLAAIGCGQQYDTLLEKLYGLNPPGIRYVQDENGNDFMLYIRPFDFGGQGKKGIVLIELDEKEIGNLLMSVLGDDNGAVFLSDQNGYILYGYEQAQGIIDNENDTVLWQNFVAEQKWSDSHTVINTYKTKYNRWSLITVIPQTELFSKIGSIKYTILILCVVSILIGADTCLWHWNNSRPVVAKFVRYSEKYPEEAVFDGKKKSIWKCLVGVLERLENLHITVEKQKEWVREGIVRKILYGSYESEEELETDLKSAEIDFPIEFPCFLVGLVIENAVGEELAVGSDILETALKESLACHLVYPFRLCRMDSVNYTVLISSCEQEMTGEQLKQIFEKMNYALYSQIPINIYTGISNPADNVLSVSEEYEHVCRICEYAKYYKLRTPLLLRELPRHQHVIFTVEMEMQFEKAIRNGTEEQINKILGQIMENCFNTRGGYRTAEHNLEVLRCIVLRCLDHEEANEKTRCLNDQIHHAKNTNEMAEVTILVWRYFADKRALSESCDVEMQKMQIEEKLEQEYSKVEFNLASLADWMKVPEKKLYRDFKKMFGVSFSSYLEVLRIRHAQEYLKQGNSVQDVAAAVGYGSDYSFRRAFKRVVGVTPSDYQKI